MEHRRLLIIPCSRTKAITPGLLPAWERYQGRVYRLLKELASQQQFPNSIDIVIISGKYGFLRPFDLVELYDQPMTAELASKHCREVQERLSAMCDSNRYWDCFVLLEPEYLAVLGDLHIPNVHIERKIDQSSLERLKQWIMREGRQ